MRKKREMEQKRRIREITKGRVKRTEIKVRIVERN